MSETKFSVIRVIGLNVICQSCEIICSPQSHRGGKVFHIRRFGFADTTVIVSDYSKPVFGEKFSKGKIDLLFYARCRINEHQLTVRILRFKYFNRERKVIGS